MLQHRDMGREPGIIPHKKPKSFLVSQSAPTCCDGHHCEGKALGDVKSIVLEEGVFVYFYCVFHRDDGLGWDPGGPISCGNFSPGSLKMRVTSCQCQPHSLVSLSTCYMSGLKVISQGRK